MEPLAKKRPSPKVENQGMALIAKKDWHILCGSFIVAKGAHEFDFKIKAGDDVSKLPGWALNALRTEKVI